MTTVVMTIDEELQLQPATSGDGATVPEGRFTLHLTRLEKAPPSSFNPEAGPRIKWVFNLYAENVETMERGSLFYFNGDPYEFWRTTSRANTPRAYARQYAEALMGRKMEERESPNLGSLVGLKMSALISYDPDANDPTRQVLKMTGLRHVPAQTAPSKPAPGQVSSDPSDEDIDRALIVTQLQKKVARLTKIDASAGAAAKKAVDASDLTDAPLDEVHALLSQVEAAIEKAMDD